MSVKVLIVDDNEINRQGLRLLLESQPDIRVVGEARDGQRALASASESAPEIVIINGKPSDMSCVNIVRQLRKTTPGVKIIVLSVHPDEITVKGLLTVRAAGLLAIDATFMELAGAIKNVSSGQPYLSSSVAQTLVKDAVRATTNKLGRHSLVLTLRQRRILRLIAEEWKPAQIAEKCNISIKTVYKHRHNAMTKLRINTVAGLTKYAIQYGLTSLAE